MHLFYTPDITENLYALPEEESEPLCQSASPRSGRRNFSYRRKGGFYRCEIIQAQPKRCEVRCIEKTEGYGKRDFHIHIAIAPTKNIERIEWFLEKCTEIGIDEITPLLCAHSGTQGNQGGSLGESHYFCHETILKSLLAETQPVDGVFPFRENNPSPLKCIAHCDEGNKKSLQEIYQPGQEITILYRPGRRLFGK